MLDTHQNIHTRGCTHRWNSTLAHSVFHTHAHTDTHTETESLPVGKFGCYATWRVSLSVHTHTWLKVSAILLSRLFLLEHFFSSGFVSLLSFFQNILNPSPATLAPHRFREGGISVLRTTARDAQIFLRNTIALCTVFVSFIPSLQSRVIFQG